MKLVPFELERIQSEWEHTVKFNLSESGVEPLRIKELLSDEQMTQLVDLQLGYTQTNGTIPLRSAIALPYKEVEANQISVTTGGAEANFLSAWWLLHENGDSGDISMMVPNYLQIQGAWNALGGSVRPFHLRMDSGRWSLDIEELKESITRNTLAISICNPSNPCGSVLGDDEMRAIADLARDRDLWVISDEVYQGAELDGHKTKTMFDMHEKVIVNASLSKAFGLPGLRLGWAITPSEKIANELWAYSDYTTICPSAASDWMATIALQPEKRSWIEQRTQKILRKNWAIISKWLDKHSDAFEYIPPRAAAICYPLLKMEISSLEFVRRLLDEKSVLATAGEHFGMPGYIRLGYGCEPDYLEDALALVSEFLGEV